MHDWRPTSDRAVILDIDGVLNPFGPPPADGWSRWETHPERSDLTVSREMADAIAGLGVDVVWLTSWSASANHVVSTFLGWPDLLVLEKQSVPGWWKLGAVEHFLDAAGHTRVVWVDDDLRQWADEIDDRLGEQLDAGRLHLVCPDGPVGLTRTDLDRVAAALT